MKINDRPGLFVNEIRLSEKGIKERKKEKKRKGIESRERKKKLFELQKEINGLVI